ncbi:MAG: T9SS type A sorting domain-containing protein [Saprospiraceae bacterium]
MRHLFLLLLLIWTTFSSAQKLVSASTLEIQTANALNVNLFIIGSSVRVEYDMELVKIEYETLGSDGKIDIASGLMIFPLTVDKELPLHAHFHGTSTRDNVPSVKGGGYELGLVYAGNGHFVIMPDYIGMGSSRGFHPYVHRVTQASAGLDMAFAAKEYVESRDDIAISDILSIAGYSQGGHAAMSFQQLIETEYSEQFDLIASTPMSGPYDLSGAFRTFLFSDNEYLFPGYLLYQIIGYNTIYGTMYENIADILKEPYVQPAVTFSNTGTKLDALHNTLNGLLVANEGKSLPIKMFKDEYVMELESNDDHPLNVALKENNTYNFKANAPTRIIYCTADDQVPFRNSLVADSILNANGSINVTSIDIKSDASHSGCVFPAVEESLRFISEFLNSTSTYETIDNQMVMSLYPNPAGSFIKMSLGEGEDGDMEVNIYNVQAQLIKTIYNVSKNNGEIDLSDLQTGTYVIQVITDEGIAFKKLIKS